MTLFQFIAATVASTRLSATAKHARHSGRHPACAQPHPVCVHLARRCWATTAAQQQHSSSSSSSSSSSNSSSGRPHERHLGSYPRHRPVDKPVVQRVPAALWIWRGFGSVILSNLRESLLHGCSERALVTGAKATRTAKRIVGPSPASKRHSSCRAPERIPCQHLM
jgi:hypothetical protein